MDELIYTLTAYYGATFTIIVIAALMILVMGMTLLPFFVWSIHNQTSKTTKEIIRLNNSIERLISRPATHDRLKQGLSKERRSNEIIKEIFDENEIEPLAKQKTQKQKTRRKKVFYNPEDELPDYKKKSS